jgi:hypothetical protein
MAASAIGSFPTRRIAVATLVLVLHAAFIALLVRATLSYAPTQTQTREQLYWLTLRIQPKFQAQPKPETPTLPVRHTHAHTPSRTRAPSMPDYRGIAFPPASSEADLKGLHLFLFDCSLENQANLSPEQRAQCAQAKKKPDDSVDYADHTDRSQDATHWARGRDRKNQPLLLPCASPQGAGISLGTLICLGHGLVNGFDLDNMPGYADKPTATHVPNNGDPPDRSARENR